MNMNMNMKRILTGVIIGLIAIAAIYLITSSLTSIARRNQAAPAAATYTITLPHTTQRNTTPADATVFMIVMENHNWSEIKNNPAAPYINQTLLPVASHAEQYYNPPNNHPSEPNYLWLEAGTNFGVHDDNPPLINHQPSTAHLVTLLDHAGITWKSYQEDIPDTTCPLSSNMNYSPKHNPMVFFDDVTGNNNPNSPYCIAHVRPFSELATDLAQNKVAGYNFLTPNLCNDMHNSCTPLYNNIRQGDTWLEHVIPMIMNSQAYNDNGVIFITWDEGEQGDGPIGLIALASKAKGNGYANTIHYTHSSLLRTVQEIFHVTPLLGDAANATDLSDLFNSLP